MVSTRFCENYGLPTDVILLLFFFCCFLLHRGAAVTGLQNISRLSMFHGKELRPGSLQPYARTVAKHIKSLRSQVARAACTAVQKMFLHVPRSVESVITCASFLLISAIHKSVTTISGRHLKCIRLQFVILSHA